MALFIQILLIAGLLLISYQDIRYRKVLWVLFPLVAMLIFIQSYHIFSVPLHLLTIILMNMGFIAYLIGIIALYYWIKNKSFNDFFNRFIGLGDLLMLVALTPLFSFLNFVFFITLSCFIMLIIYMVQNLFTYNKKYSTIPMAGYLATFALILNAAIIFKDSLRSILLDDSFVFKMLNL